MDHALPIGRKSLGQHWLYDVACLQAMCDAAEITAKDVVLEIGPGLGTLTKLLVKQAKRVVAVEFDKQLAYKLLSRVPAKNLEVVEQDILQLDLTYMPTHYKVVANIPYYLTSNLIRVLSESVNPPSQAALLVQKEVAERIAATPGDMSLLSVSAQFYWEISLGRTVAAELFVPPPKVDSQIILLHRRPRPLFADVTTKQFFRLVKAGFAGRRKTLLNSLSGGLQLDKKGTSQLLERAAIEAKLRAQNLSLEDWHRLYQAWHQPQATEK